MPTTLYDEEGNPIEGASTAEEVKAIQDEKALKEAELAEVKEKLSKLENKDFNFKKLRDMNKEEQEKLTAHEMELLQRQEKLEDDQKSFLQKQIESHKDEASAVLAGENEELRKKILFHYDRIKDEAMSRDEVYKKMREAATLAKGEGAVGVNPVLSGINIQGSPPSGSNNKPESEDSREMRQHFHISDEEKQKLGGEEWTPKFK